MEDNPLLPVKNKHSLIGYYVSLAGFIPLIGLPASITAFVLGILALKYEKKVHVPGAKAHAIIAIVLGAILGSIHILLSVIFIVALIVES